MTFKHVFWEDAMELKNAKDGIRLFFLIITTVSSLLFMYGSALDKTIEFLSPISPSVYLFILLSILFLIGICFYINTSLQGFYLTDEWTNDGDRDGRYWMEHVFLSNMLLISVFLYFDVVFSNDFFGTDGVLSSSELLIELPLTYVIFASLFIGVAYILFCSVLLVVEFIRLFLPEKEENFTNKKRILWHEWASLDEQTKEQMTLKINLLEEALMHYSKLTKNQKKQTKHIMDELFNHVINECKTLSNQKNLLK